MLKMVSLVSDAMPAVTVLKRHLKKDTFKDLYYCIFQDKFGLLDFDERKFKLK